MKKVTAFIGSARKKATYSAVQEFEKELKAHKEIDFEYVFLSEYRLEFCQGCKLCFDKGEEFCPLKDDRDFLLEKLEGSDGVILATPSYAFQVSARMKNFLDRFSYLFHRPRFFGKTFTAIVTHGVPIGGSIRKYLESSGANLGFDVVRGSCVQSMELMTEMQKKKGKQKIRKLSGRFYKRLHCSKPSVPSLFRLLLFRMTRTMLQSIDVKYFDYIYYEEKGWFHSDYFHETKLGPVKKLAGFIFDKFAGMLAKRT